MKPKRVKKAPKIRILILQWFRIANVGDQFLSDDLCSYVLRYLRGGARDDTILRYARNLRQEGKINFNYRYKESRICEVIPMGETHSV